MVAASFWSLLDPAIEMAQNSKLYGQDGEYAFAPVSLGFLLGALFVYATDVLLTHLGIRLDRPLQSLIRAPKKNPTLKQEGLTYDAAPVDLPTVEEQPGRRTRPALGRR